MNKLRANSLIHSEALAYLSFFKQDEHCSVPGFSLFLLIIWLSGCSTVNTKAIDEKPFIAFNSAASQIVQVEDAVSNQISNVKESYIARMALDSDKVTQLSLKFDHDDIYEYDYKFTAIEEPLFIKWEKVGSGLTELNQTFIDYTQLLSQLAGGDLDDEEAFDLMATNLNNNAFHALTALNKEPEKSRLALFSAAAMTAAQNYINTKRKQFLIELINDNQLLVEAYINAGRNAVEILADDTKAEYQNSIRSLLKQWTISRPNSDKRKIASRIYCKSELTARTLDMLKAMDRSYELLAKTHQSLAAALEHKGFSISKLKDSLKRTQKLYKKLKKANEEFVNAAGQSGSG